MNTFEIDDVYIFLIDLYEGLDNDLFRFLSIILSNFPEISKVYQLFITKLNGKKF